MPSIFHSFPHENELLNACRILFGPRTAIDHSFLERLQNKELKSVFRRRALDTHPDRHVHWNQPFCDSTQSFIEIAQAYDQLNSFLKERIKFRRYQRDAPGIQFKPKPPSFGSSGKGPPFSGNTPFGRNPDTCSFSQQNPVHSSPCLFLPRWELKLGEYLFYSGLITWGELIAAILWQRSHRPMLGQIALHWNWISPEHLHVLLLRRNRGEKVGEALLRNGIINSFQKAMLLRHQKQSQPLLGQYFIHSGKLREFQMNAHLQNMSHHNYQITSTKKEPSGIYSS